MKKTSYIALGLVSRGISGEIYSVLPTIFREKPSTPTMQAILEEYEKVIVIAVDQYAYVTIDDDPLDDSEVALSLTSSISTGPTETWRRVKKD